MLVSQISMQAWLPGSLLRWNKDGSLFCQNMIEKQFGDMSRGK
jgi:hypothetical protein